MDYKKIVNPWSSMTFPQFDCDKHHLLCSELKQLYVAVTRTRNRLWIAETNDVFARPVFDYWKAAGVIQVQSLNFKFIKKMEVTCNKEEWNARGTKVCVSLLSISLSNTSSFFLFWNFRICTLQCILWHFCLNSF